MKSFEHYLAYLANYLCLLYLSHGKDAEFTLGHEPSDQHILYNELFKQYNKNIRPVSHHDDVLHIYMNAALYNDSETGLLMTNCEVILIWKDIFLSWNPSAFNDTKLFRIPHHLIWIPDVILSNLATTNYYDSLVQTNVIINNTGHVRFSIHGTFVSYCEINIEWFPFDEQLCGLEFMSWTSNTKQILLHGQIPSLLRFTDNHEFFLEDFYVTEGQNLDATSKEPFSIVTYHIQLQRRVKFSLYFFIFPGILINICAILVFALPVESGEKINLGVNAILAMIVFLTEMSSNLPPSERIPVAGVYYGCCLVAITLNILFTVLVINISSKGTGGIQINPTARDKILQFANWLSVTIPPKIQEKWLIPQKLFQKRNTVKGLPEIISLKTNIHFNKFEEKKNGINRISRSSSQDCLNSKNILAENVSNHSDVFNIVKDYINKETKERESESYRDMCIIEWKFASKVFDRICLILFASGVLIFNVYVLTMSPHKTEFLFCPQGRGRCEGWTEEQRSSNIDA